MAKVLDQPRYKCALAAMQTVHAITGALPIIHSGPGCASKLNENTGTGGFFNPNVFPCTSISEKEVVFGGNNKLRSTIHNAFRVIDADLYVVLSGCMGEIVGDDIQEVTEEFTDSGKDIVWVKTPGFQGNNFSAITRKFNSADRGRLGEFICKCSSARPILAWKSA